MPSKRHWALNPRKWFGTIASAAHKRDLKSQTNNLRVPLPPTGSAKIRTIPLTSTVPRLLTERNKTKVTPTIYINNNNINSTNALTSFTQFQLPAFKLRREKTVLFNHTNTFVTTRVEPSIRKNSQVNEDLAVDATRWNTQPIVYNTTKPIVSSSSLSTQYENFSQQYLIKKQSNVNISDTSHECLINYPQNLSNNLTEKCPSPPQSRLSSSIDDNDERDESSSSGIFTDERTDVNERHRTESKDTLSTVEVLSIESIADSQSSLNHCPSRPLVHRYRLPMPTFETIDNKSTQLQHQTPITHSNRTRSADEILNDNQIITPIIPKGRQSSAAIVKKIEKRIPTSRSPFATLEKSGFKRITNHTYRLTVDKDNHLYRRQRRNSIIQYSNYDDSLPPANDEETYASLPRISSTEQLNNNVQNDVRAIIDDYLRPIITSINKTDYRSIKTHHRSKRSHINNEHVQINIEHMTDRLLSSIDSPIYSQYQRCY